MFLSCQSKDWLCHRGQEQREQAFSRRRWLILQQHGKFNRSQTNSFALNSNNSHCGLESPSLSWNYLYFTFFSFHLTFSNLRPAWQPLGPGLLPDGMIFETWRLSRKWFHLAGGRVVCVSTHTIGRLILSSLKTILEGIIPKSNCSTLMLVK